MSQGNRVQRALLTLVCRWFGWTYFWFWDADAERRRLWIGATPETLRLEVRPNEDGTIDEVLIYRGAECLFHLEQLDDDAYWFAWYGPDEHHFDIHRHGKKVTITDRARDRTGHNDTDRIVAAINRNR